MPSPATRRLILKRLLDLPSPLLRLLAGGGVVYQGGRTLDPRIQYLAAQAAKGRPMTTMTPEHARRANARAMVLMKADPEPGVKVEPLSVPGGDGPIAARLYSPVSQDPATPLFIYAHHGGGVIGDLDSAEAFCSVLAKTLRGPVLSMDYRLAPEHRFPAALEDVLAAYRWGRDNAARFGAPAGVAAIGGDSQGGSLAAVACQELRRAGEPQPVLQLLIYPCVDVACRRPSMTTYADAFPLPASMIAWFMGHYMGPGDDPADPRLSAIREPDLSGLAPAVIATAGFDPLLDQGEAYARSLKAAGVPATYRCYDSLAHGFTAFTGVVPAADLACREIASLVKQTLEGQSA